ncbi:MAG: site-specific DNA-methyltransferase [Elusimicrobia bacterium]|nr:site-specific DNA-methyltransferase [Elusimicrobiota bacterium]
MQKTKLELTWIGKENRPKLEPRILVEDKDRSHHAPFRADKDGFDNRLIFGDNLLALRAIEQEFAGKIKCIFLDPPYNTGSAFEHYDDGIEHSLWLSLMRDRLDVLHRLLREDGAIWISIDDNEMPYLRVLLDEIFGRSNFVAVVCWQKKYGAKSDSKFLSESHEYVLCYAKDKNHVALNRMPRTAEQDARYKNQDNDPRGPWTSGDLLRNEVRDYAIYPITGPSGRKHLPPKGTSWRFTKEKFAELVVEKRIWFGEDGNNVPRLKRFLNEVAETVPATTWWEHKDVGHNDEAKKESKVLFGDDLFGTPKPERLMQRILLLGSNPGDWVLDSFAGSGTTGAVAQKMGRRWIMVELGEHCHTHIIPRLKKVIDGKDPGGITEAVGWNGGGGFRYYRLAPSLLEKDQFGNWVISKKYDAVMLAEAICKLEGFVYRPSDTLYWEHGRSTEKDFIYVTTQTLSRDELERLSDEVGEDRTLLVMCGAFRVKDPDEFPNLTVKKIPKAVLARCEWGHDDYSLEIKNLPLKVEDEPSPAPAPKPRSKTERREEALLFDLSGVEGDAS